MSNSLEGTSLVGGLPTESIQLPIPGVEGLNWWLNPDGSITEGGASPGPLLPHGVSDTGFKGQILADGTIVYFDPSNNLPKTLDGNFYNSQTQPENTDWVWGNQITALQGTQDVFLSTFHQLAANSAGSVNAAEVKAFRSYLKYTKAGPLALLDLGVNIQTDGVVAGTAKSAASFLAGLAIGAGVATAAAIFAPAAAALVLTAAASAVAAYGTSVIWDNTERSDYVDRFAESIKQGMLDIGTTPNTHPSTFESKVLDALLSISDGLNDGISWVSDLMDGIHDWMISTPIPDTAPGSFESLILDKLLNLSNSLSKLQSLFGFDAPGSLTDNINSLFNMIDRAANPPRDPLVLDLDGDGVETIGTDAGIVFDHDGDGLKHGTGWANADDGLLVYDKNGNGIIDDGSELFGDNHRANEGTVSEKGFVDGFHALRHYDSLSYQASFNDNVIDQNDAIFADLQIWRDINQDGIR